MSLIAGLSVNACHSPESSFSQYLVHISAVRRHQARVLSDELVMCFRSFVVNVTLISGDQRNFVIVVHPHGQDSRKVADSANASHKFVNASVGG